VQIKQTSWRLIRPVPHGRDVLSICIFGLYGAIQMLLLLLLLLLIRVWATNTPLWQRIVSATLDRNSLSANIYNSLIHSFVRPFIQFIDSSSVYNVILWSLHYGSALSRVTSAPQRSCDAVFINGWRHGGRGISHASLSTSRMSKHQRCAWIDLCVDSDPLQLWHVRIVRGYIVDAHQKCFACFSNCWLGCHNDPVTQ